MNIRIGPATLLGILFVALKLTGVIAWSWWWVLAPFWISVAVCLTFVVVVLAVAVVGEGA
jgi:hypothetical protein